jgi:hypothetical protein
MKVQNQEAIAFDLRDKRLRFGGGLFLGDLVGIAAHDGVTWVVHPDVVPRKSDPGPEREDHPIETVMALDHDTLDECSSGLRRRTAIDVVARPWNLKREIRDIEPHHLRLGERFTFEWLDERVGSLDHGCTRGVGVGATASGNDEHKGCKDGGAVHFMFLESRSRDPEG